MAEALTTYHVIEAANGHQALSILEKPGCAVNLVVSDLVMPEMGGLELCREIRRMNLPVKITIVSGYISNEILDELKSLDVIDCLKKPVDVAQLLNTLERASAGSGQVVSDAT